MRLVRLAIDRLPGIGPAFTLEGLDPGITLIHGPNASGKSSLVRALRYLVVPPSSQDPPDLVLAAVFEAADGRWEVTRTGQGVAWRRDGAPAEPPLLPEAAHLHCYWLSIEDLLDQHPDDRDRALLDQLQREVAGGFDVPAVRAVESFRIGARHGQREEKALRDAESALRKVEREHEALRRDEERLPALERAREAAVRAGARAELCERAVELVWIERARRGEGTGIEDAAAAGRHLAKRLLKLLAERAGWERKIEDARRLLAKTGLAEPAPDGADLRARRRELDRLADLARQRQGTVRRRDEATLARRQAAEALGADPAGASPRLDPGLVGRAEAAAREVHECQTQVETLRTKLERARAEAADERALERATAAAGELRRWLRAGGSRPRWVGAAVAAAGALAVAGLYVLAGDAGAAAAVGAAALGLLALLLLLWPMRGRGEARRRFRETGLQPPAAWEPASVGARLEALEAEEAELRARLREAQEREALERELEAAQGELAASREGLEALAGEVGFNPALVLEFDRFVRLAAAWDEAARALGQAEAELERLGREMEPVAQRLHAFLAKWGERPTGDGGDPEQLRDAFDRLETRAGEAAEARSRLEEADRELARLADELERLAEERRDRLADEAELAALVEAEDEPGIESLRRDLEEEAARAERHRQERADIRAKLAEARRRHDLEEALARRDEARAELEARRDEALYAAAGLFLLDEVEREHRVESQPAVLRDAAERFARFTRDAFALELDAGGNLVARDRAQGAERSLAQLSVGTRMQLLLALRMAWARSLESHREALPIVLDEALTTSDPERFAKVAGSLESLAAEEGRQILYLTAQVTDLALWERGTGRPPFAIDLLEVRRQGSTFGPEAFRLPEREGIPEPREDETPEAYAGRLGVPLIDPWAEPGLIHPFHLLRDDLPLLHHLLAVLGVSTLGQLEGLLERTGGDDAFSEERALELAQRACAARRWIEAYRTGDGRPVDRVALEESGAVSEIFLDQVAELADQLGGDAEGLVEAMRDGGVPRFRADKLDELESWLEDHGYLDRREPLDVAARRRETLLGLGRQEAEKEWNFDRDPTPDDPQELGAARAAATARAEVIDWLESGVAAKDRTAVRE